MPQLEARRSTRSAAAAGRHSLILSLDDFLNAAARRWALSWAVLHLAGFTLGGWLAADIPLSGAPETFAGTVRLAGCLVPGLAGGRRSVAIMVWLAVFSLSVAAGVLERNERSGRVAATAARPWTPAADTVLRGAGVVRTTGWANPVAGSKPRWRGPARIAAWRSEDSSGNAVPMRGEGVMVTGVGVPPPPGALLGGELQLRVPGIAALPGGFDYRGFLAGRGLRWLGRLDATTQLPGRDPVAAAGRSVIAPVRAALLGELRTLLPPFEANLAAAVLLGHRTVESRAASRPFADLGLAHLFSVSGLHVGILLGIFLLPGNRLGWSPGWRVGPLVLILPLYALLTGLPGSVIRAAGLGFLGSAAVLAGRRIDALHGVGLLFWAGSIWEPAQNLDAGLRLSYLAAGGILAVSSRAADSGVLGDGWRKAVAAGLGVSLAAQWFTLPQIALSFGRISLLSPAANLVAVPLFGIALWLVVSALAAHFVFPWLGESLAAGAWLILRALAGAAGWASSQTGGWGVGLAVPGPGRIAVLASLTLYLLVLLNPARPWSALRRRVGVVTVLAVGFLVVAPWGADPAERSGPIVWAVDVGQGDCLLVLFPDRWAGLIDTGGRFGRGRNADGPLARSLLPFLQRGGRSRLDAVVLTHDHLDHTGGVFALDDRIEVGRYICGGRSAESLADLDAATVSGPEGGEVLHRWREWTLEVLYPCDELPEDFSENNRSIVLGLFRNRHCVMVFSGDLEVEGEAVWLACGTVPEAVQVWKSGHHGSDTSGSRALLERMRPETVLISCGVGNRYEHPSHGPYVAAGDTLPILRTDLHGTVRLRWTADGNLEIETVYGRTETGRLDTPPRRS